MTTTKYTSPSIGGTGRVRSAAAIAVVALTIVGVQGGGAATTKITAAAVTTPTPVSSCQELDAPGAYALTADLATVDATCIEITASDVMLDLAGHTISCTGSGFEGSCQVPGFINHGIRVASELAGISIKGPGTIDGLDNGVSIVGSDALVKGVTITGPACDPSACGRPLSNGIAVAGRLIGDPTAGIVDIGPTNVSLVGNRVSNHTRGIFLVAECTGAGQGCVLNGNVVENNAAAFGTWGILGAIRGYALTRNVARSNGACSACFPGGGIALSSELSTGNVVTNNDSSDNRGWGFAGGPGTTGNLFVNNTARGNTVADLSAAPGTENKWLDNNRCHTESGAVPPSVCNPGE